MNVPLFCWRNTGAAARNTVNVPFKCVSMTGSHSSSHMLKSMRSRRMPATHTTPSMRPNVSIALLHDRRAAVHRRDAARVGGGAAARVGDLGDDLVGDLARRVVAVDADAVVVDDDRRALGCAGERDRAADAAACAGHCDHLAVERTHESLRQVQNCSTSRGTVSRRGVEQDSKGKRLVRPALEVGDRRGDVDPRYRLRLAAVHERGGAVVVDPFADPMPMTPGRGCVLPARAGGRVRREVRVHLGPRGRSRKRCIPICWMVTRNAGGEDDRVGDVPAVERRRSRGSRRQLSGGARRRAARRRTARRARPCPTRCRRSPRARCRRWSGAGRRRRGTPSLRPRRTTGRRRSGGCRSRSRGTGPARASSSTIVKSRRITVGFSRRNARATRRVVGAPARACSRSGSRA